MAGCLQFFGALLFSAERNQLNLASAVHFSITLQNTMVSYKVASGSPALRLIFGMSLLTVPYPEIKRDETVVEDYFGTKVKLVKRKASANNSLSLI